MDLLQYMSESLDTAWAATSTSSCQQAAPKCDANALQTCLTVGSSCSSHGGQMLPETPAYSKHTQQCQQSPASSTSTCTSCHSDAVPAPVLSSSPASSISTVAEDHQQQQASAGVQASVSSARSYPDDFVWQCYFGDPNSDANKQQQRPQRLSPFAAFSTFPGFSL